MKDLSESLRDSEGAQNANNRALIQEISSLKLAAYFRTLTWMARNGAVSTTNIGTLAALYDVQDALHIDCDEAKRHLLVFWCTTALSATSTTPVETSTLALAAQPATFRRLLDSFISLRPQDRSMVYNLALLPSFYGLLRAALSFEATLDSNACMQALHTHRNWEWAIRYVLVESADYADLLPLHVARQLALQARVPADGAKSEPKGYSLAETLLWLLASMSHYPHFRAKVLHATLGGRINVASGNVLVLLDLLIETMEDIALAAEMRLLPRLADVIDVARQRVANGDGASTSSNPSKTLLVSLRLASRVSNWLSSLDKQDSATQQRRQRVLDAAGILGDPARLDLLLQSCIDLLAPVIRLRPLAPAQYEVLEPMIRPAYALAGSLASLDARCASVMLDTLTSHHQQPPSASSLDDIPLSRCHTLAGLLAPQAREAVASRATELSAYYEFASALVYSSITSHMHEVQVIDAGIRLGLQLAAEGALVPSACMRTIELLHQAARLASSKKDHPVAQALRAELGRIYGDLEARSAPDSSEQTLLLAGDVFSRIVLQYQEALALPPYREALAALMAVIGTNHDSVDEPGMDGNTVSDNVLPNSWVVRAQAELANQIKA